MAKVSQGHGRLKNVLRSVSRLPARGGVVLAAAICCCIVVASAAASDDDDKSSVPQNCL